MSIINTGINATEYLQTLPPDWPGGFWWHWLVFAIGLILFILLLVMGFIYIERRVLGRMQSRLGPNRAGPFGLLQPVADAIKVLLKEDIVPSNADKIVHFFAPIVTFFPVMLIFAVVPFADGALLADLNIGILYVVAVSSMSTIGAFMAGWSSSNKYSLLGAMRYIASVVSYEMPLVLSIVGVVLVAGSLSMNQIVIAQNIPFILVQPLGFLIMFMSACAEINRSPFDLFEADQEIVAGFHTEYSGMKFAMFYLVEYAEALAMSCIITTLYLSGWKGPFLPPWLWFIVKVILVFFVMIWVRTTMPRIRVDQLMALAWKFLLPLAIINLFVTAIEILVFPTSLAWTWLTVIINFAVMAILIVLWSKLFKPGWGRVEV